MKIVINNCFGGFGLSPLAVQEYAKRKGKECYFFRNTNATTYQLSPLTLEEATKELFCYAYAVPNPNDYHIKELNERYISSSDIPRNDPDLVAVVEELGERASGKCAELKVVEIPDDADWEISEYDGAEHVAEKHRTWS